MENQNQGENQNQEENLRKDESQKGCRDSSREHFGIQAAENTDSGENGRKNGKKEGGKEGRKKEGRKERRGRKAAPWFVQGIGVCLAAAVFFTSLYGVFWSNKDNEAYGYSPIELESNINWLYQNSYVLYRDLYNMVNQTNASYTELYIEGLQEQLALSGDDAEAADEQDAEGSVYSYVEGEAYLSGEEEERYAAAWFLYSEYTAYFKNLEEAFPEFNETYDYLIRDTKTGKTITNLADGEINPGEQYFYLAFSFDKDGNVTIDSDLRGRDVTSLRKYANGAARSYSLPRLWERRLAGESEMLQKAASHCQLHMPADCQVIYCIDTDDWNRMREEGILYAAYMSEDSIHIIRGHWATELDDFINTGIAGMLSILMAMVFLGAVFWPGAARGEPWKESIILRLPLEGLLVSVYFLINAVMLVLGVALTFCNGELVSFILQMLPWLVNFYWLPEIAAVTFNLLVLTLYFFCIWYLGICLRAVWTMGIRKYLRERCLLYRLWLHEKNRLKNWGRRIHDGITHMDITRDASKYIIKIVLVNALILFSICCLWFGGAVITVIYSIILYCILRRYVSDLQKKYGLLLNATNRIAEGDLNVTIEEDLGVFEPFKPQIARIQNGFQKAVEEEVKSQRMKTELITNVSHDLKTPLTAIITYIGILKDENITEEQRREYLNTLEQKSLRLKVLIEDLFEMSKANSQTMILNIMEVDAANLLRQVLFEMSDKLSGAGLEVRLNVPEEKVILHLDSQKTYRIYENLFGNVAKYAMPGTRVYVELYCDEEQVVITIKNITASEITVSAEELTERFVRGDASRNTEGSGLGLAIAKSFTELQGGKLSVEIDGDLFKAVTIFPILGNNPL